MRFVFERNGFEVIDIRSEWEGEHLVAIVKKVTKNVLNGIKVKFESLKQEFEDLLGREKKLRKRIAIWGASTHSITLLALIKPDGIEFIVDSSEYKQNRFTPVSNIPVFAPSKIMDSEIDIVIVMAPRYTSEIIHQLKSELNFNGRIVVLNNSSLLEH